MPVTYSKCPAEVAAVVKRMIKEFHPDLAECEAKVECLFAHPELKENGEIVGPPVKVGGYPCAAKIRKTNLKERTAGRADAEIIIDHQQWEMLTEDEHDALIDHELEHLEVKRDGETNAIKTDDQARPVFAMKLHDAQVGVFKSVICRHGRHALDLQIASKFISEYSQLMLFDPPASKTRNISRELATA